MPHHEDRRDPRVALATSAEARGLDDDEPLLLAALGRAGIEAAAVAWDDPGVAWERFDAVVVRSTWDYPRRYTEFLAWAGQVGAVTRLRNPVDVLRWSTDKRYLRHLAGAGVPVVPTWWAPVGVVPTLPRGGDVVVKPVVSAGGLDTARHEAGSAEALAHVRRLHAVGRHAMVQPWLPSVARSGETGVVFVAGTFSHAVRRRVPLPPGGVATTAREGPAAASAGAASETAASEAIAVGARRSASAAAGAGTAAAAPAGTAGGLFLLEEVEPVAPTARQRAVAEQVLSAAPFDRGRLLYARVDLVAGDGGEPMLLEMELVEPSLYLVHHDGAAEALAAALRAEALGTTEARP